MSKLEIINESAVNQEVDCIVNAANKYLINGSGICGQIFHQAGSRELEEECNKIKTPLKDGEAVITSACQLKNAKKIIHAVGPNFSITKEAYQELFNAYYNSLLLLKENHLRSISFPLISSGIYGGNLENPAKTSSYQGIKAYHRFIKEYPNYDIEVKLCAYTREEFLKTQEALKEYQDKEG